MRNQLSDEEYQALLRQDLSIFIQRSFLELNGGTPYLHNWHIDLIASKLMDVCQGKIRRLIINIPPRNLKSICASVAFPAWLLGHDPTKKVICASYAQDLAEKLARDCRQIMRSEWYQALFACTRLSPFKVAVNDFETTRGGGRMAVSTGGGITGRGGDVLIIDDAIKPDQAFSEVEREGANRWYDTTLYSRLNDKQRGAIIIIMQRLHLDDLVGHVLAQEGWEVVSLPAIAESDETYFIKSILGTRIVTRHAGEALHPERESLAILEQLRASLGEYNFAGQYQQSPMPLGGGIIKTAWLQYLADSLWPNKFEQVIQSWDTASKVTELSDYSVCTTWGIAKKRAYLIDVCRVRLEFPGLKKKALELYAKYKPSTILVEDKSSGIQLIQEFRNENFYQVKAVKPQGDKAMRLHMQAAFIESGGLVLPGQAPWLTDYVQELTSFPTGKFDDQVDSTTQALAWLQEAMNEPGIITYYRRQVEEMVARGELPASVLGE